MDPGHEVSYKASHLVSQPLGGDDGDLIADSLVRLEIQGESGIVFFNDLASGLLHSLGANATLQTLEDRQWDCVRSVLSLEVNRASSCSYSTARLIIRTIVPCY